MRLGGKTSESIPQLLPRAWFLPRTWLLPGLVATGLLLCVSSHAAQQDAPAPSLPRDGMIFIGAVQGDLTSLGLLVLEKDFRTSKLLRWQSKDAALGAADTDFFKPRHWKIAHEPIEELRFMERSPDPTMNGKVMLDGAGKALVEVSVSERQGVVYMMTRLDVGPRFTDDKADTDSLASNRLSIVSSNFESQKCHMRPLRINGISGLANAVLDDTTDGVVEVFDQQGQKLSLPAALESLPAELWVSGKRPGTTGLRVDYTLSDQSGLEQEIAVQVRGEIAEGQGCPTAAATE